MTNWERSRLREAISVPFMYRTVQNVKNHMQRFFTWKYAAGAAQGLNKVLQDKRIGERTMADEGKKYVVHGMYAQCSMGTMKNYLNTDVGHGVVYQGQPLLNANDHAPQINLTHFGDCNSKMIFEEAKKQADEKYKAESGDNFFERVGKSVAQNVTKAAVTVQGCLGVNKCQLDTPLPWRSCNEEHMIDGAPALTVGSICPCKFGGIISIVEMPEPEAELSASETGDAVAREAKAPAAASASVLKETVSISMESALAEIEIQTGTLDRQDKETDCSKENRIKYKRPDENMFLNRHELFRLKVMPVHAEPLVYPKTLTEEQQYDNAKYIYTYLKLNGWSDEAACGAIGNFAHEGVLNPAEWQSKNKEENGYGLAQWTTAEKTILKKLAEEQGMEGSLSAQAADQMALANPKELMNIQLEYLLETANDSTIWGAWGKHYKPFEMKYKDYMTASVEDNKDYTAENLAYVFCAYYERPQPTSKTDLEERAVSAEKWYSTFCGGEEE